MSLLSSDKARSILTSINSLAINSSDILNIEEVEGGVLNYVYRIETKKGLFFLKYFPIELKTSSLRDIKFDAHTRCAVEFNAINIFRSALGDDKNIIPPVLYRDPENNFLIIEGVDKIHLLHSEFANSRYAPWLLGKLGYTLGKMHENTKTENLPADIDMSNSDMLKTRIKIHFFDTEKLVDSKTAEIIHELGRNYLLKKEVLTQGDLASYNILIKDGDMHKFYIIDHECAHIGSYAFDLGILLSEYIVFMKNNPDKKEEMLNGLEMFRKNYFGQLSHIDKMKVEEEAAKFIGVELIYRTLSKHKYIYTDYVTNFSVREECKEAGVFLLNNDVTLKEALSSYL